MEDLICLLATVRTLNSCRMVPPHSSQVFVYANSFEKLLQDVNPFCISFICLHFLYQVTNLKFPHLPFWVSESQFLKISLSLVFCNDEIQPRVIISLNLHYFVSLFSFLYPTLRVRTVAKRHIRSSMFTASFILVSCVKLPQFLE